MRLRCQLRPCCKQSVFSIREVFCFADSYQLVNDPSLIQVSLYTLLQVLRVLLASVSHLKAEEQVLLQRDLVQLVNPNPAQGCFLSFQRICVIVGLD